MNVRELSRQLLNCPFCGAVFGIIAFVCFAIVMAEDRATKKNKEVNDEDKV